MNRRKFLMALGAAAVAAPVAVEAVKRASNEPLFIGTSDQYSKYLTSRDTWYIKDWAKDREIARATVETWGPGGCYGTGEYIVGPDNAENARRYMEALKASMAQTADEAAQTVVRRWYE